jgi:hypothetical protein
LITPVTTKDCESIAKCSEGNKQRICIYIILLVGHSEPRKKMHLIKIRQDISSNKCFPITTWHR